MARMPGVVWSPVSDDNSKKPMQRWDVVCIHTIVGHDPAGAAHFSTGSDGLITQSRDTAVQSAANYQGNPRVIAVENEDFGPEYGSWTSPNVPRFTAAQAESIARICAWAHQAHGIPLTLCPDSKPSSRGIAYHRQGIKGNWAGFAYGGWVPGGEIWSTSTGKVCPGDNRITQLINEIIPRACVLAGLTIQEDDVSWTEHINVASPLNRGYVENHEAAQVVGDAMFYSADVYKATTGTVVPILTELAAALAGGIDGNQLTEKLIAAVKDGTEQAVNGTLLPALQRLEAALAEDNVEQAMTIVNELARRLQAGGVPTEGS